VRAWLFFLLLPPVSRNPDVSTAATIPMPGYPYRSGTRRERPITAVINVPWTCGRPLFVNPYVARRRAMRPADYFHSRSARPHSDYNLRLAILERKHGRDWQYH